MIVGMIPEIFTDGFGRITFRGGMIRVELVSFSSGEPEVRQHVIMTLSAFLKSVQAQQAVVSEFEAAGMIRAVQPSPAAPAEVIASKTPAPTAPTLTAEPKSPNFAEE
jgi:hypothetical protein